MNVRTRHSVTVVAFLVAASLPLTAAAQSAIVDREFIDFGAVIVDSSASEELTMTAEVGDVVVDSVEIEGGDGAFSITSGSDFVGWLYNGESITFEITFTPPEIGDFSDAFLVLSDSDNQIRVPLYGEGVEPGTLPSPSDLADALLATAEAAADDGDLDGTGRNARVQRARLALFLRKIEMVVRFIEEGETDLACDILNWLDARSNGERPHDFVQGDATSDVNAAVVEVLDALDCD